MNNSALLLVVLALLVLGACLGLCVSAAAPEVLPTYTAAPGPYEVATVEYTWRDNPRNRDVPVKLYYPGRSGVSPDPAGARPVTPAGPFPVIIFSHGLGGTREGYAYLGRHWASWGYVSVQVQHIGSDDSVWRGKADPLQAMKDSLQDPRNTLNRPRDIRFVLDQLPLLNQNDPALAGRLDLERIGMAGHSFGAWTTLALAGELFLGPRGRDFSFGDPRIKAAIAMSAPPTKNPATAAQAYGAITIPVLHMTGTEDYSIVTDTKPEQRRVGFDHMTGAETYLVIFNGGDHMVFSGRGNTLPGRDLDAKFQPLILMSTTAFWDAYLQGDLAARAYLSQGGFAGVMGERGTWEQKLKPEQ